MALGYEAKKGSAFVKSTAYESLPENLIPPTNLMMVHPTVLDSISKKLGEKSPLAEPIRSLKRKISLLTSLREEACFQT